MTNRNQMTRRWDPMANPFPHVLPNGKVVLDEICKCGAKRTEHGPRFVYGHGECARTGCAQFTWKATIIEGLS